MILLIKNSTQSQGGLREYCSKHGFKLYLNIQTYDSMGAIILLVRVWCFPYVSFIYFYLKVFGLTYFVSQHSKNLKLTG